MEMDIGSIIANIVGSGAIAAAVSAWFSRKKTEADATATTVKAVLDWAQMLSARISTLEKKIDEKDATIVKLNFEMHKIRNELDDIKNQGVKNG